MADRYLLVPGTSGCKLLNNGVDIGWPAELSIMSWLSVSALKHVSEALGFTPQRIQRQLSMEYADPESWFPTKSTLAAGGAISPGPVLNAAYHQFGDYSHFPYDWRSDLRASAKKLLRFLKDEKPTGGRWRVVGHSQGALVVIVASKLHAKQKRRDDAFSQLVSRFVSLASPLHGTINAADALINGDQLGGGFSNHFLKAVRTWPAIYQMLPNWRGSVRLETTGQPTRYRLMDDEAWEGLAVDNALLERARKTRRVLLKNPLSKMRGVKIRLLMSAAHPTRNHVIRTQSGLELPAIDGPDSEPGDDLVPYDSTRAMMSDLEVQRTHVMGQGGATAVHSFLANDPVFATSVKKFLGSAR